MAALRTKNVIKQSMYRVVGETSGIVRGRPREQVLRVLVYHKVNDAPGNPTTVSVARFRQQVEQILELGYQAVDLDAVLDHYTVAKPLPERAVLITFDDGYHDVLENALPILREHKLPATAFVSVSHVDDGAPFPHDLRVLEEQGLLNPPLQWDEVLELERAGVRIESHGLTHRALATLDAEEAVHEITASKRELEGRLGRPVRAFAYVKGSAADFRPWHVETVREAGYDLAFTAVSRANRNGCDPFRLGRYNGEDYSPRTFELLLRGACDLISVKDSVAGSHAKRAFNHVLGTASR